MSVTRNGKDEFLYAGHVTWQKDEDEPARIKTEIRVWVPKEVDLDDEDDLLELQKLLIVQFIQELGPRANMMLEEQWAY